MAKTPPLDARTLAWARGEFSRYYARAAVPAPERLDRREIALFPFAEANLMRRHTAARSVEELRRYLAAEIPRHVYYSSAYYRHPEAASMAAKEWFGADLIFDLDADHLRGAETLDYPGQLSLVKSRLIDLVDDFLVRDFGVSPRSTSFVFSGGRGYHVHVRDERFARLTSPERRELVDYILGTNIDPKRAVERASADVRSGRTVAVADEAEAAPLGRRGRGASTLRLAPPDAPGWRGRTTRALLALLARWEAEGAPKAASELIGWGADARKARRWAKFLVEEKRSERIRTTLALDVFGQESPEEFLELVVRRAAIEVQGETDAPVTTDIHRLIRLPGSLHGGTGFQVVPLSREAIDGFDPFASALLPDEGRRTTVELLADVRYPFPDGGLVGRVGETVKLATPRALFLVLRGEAALRP